MLVLQSSTFVSQREAAELWVILKSLHTDGMRGKESFKKMVKNIFLKTRPGVDMVKPTVMFKSSLKID